MNVEWKREREYVDLCHSSVFKREQVSALAIERGVRTCFIVLDRRGIQFGRKLSNHSVEAPLLRTENNDPEL